MSKNKEIHSEPYKLVKKYYFYEKLPVYSIHLSFANKNKEDCGKIVFLKDKQEVAIKSSEPDFVRLLFNFKSTFRDGKEQIIDISTTPAKDTEAYYKNMRPFIDREKKDVGKTIERLVSGEYEIPRDLEVIKGIRSILNKDFEEKNAQIILENYFEVIGVLILELDSTDKLFKKMKENTVRNSNRFYSFMAQSDKIFRDNIRNLSPIHAFHKIDDGCVVDTTFLAVTLSQTLVQMNQKWDGLSQRFGGKLEAHIGAQHLIKEYIDIYEIIKRVLRDLAFLVKTDEDSVNLDSQEDVINFLKRKGYSSLVGIIDIHLRNAGTHFSLDYSKKGYVQVYDSPTKKRKLVKEFTLEEIIDKRKKIEELALSLLYTYLINEHLILLKTIDSPDFKFFVVENKC